VFVRSQERKGERAWGTQPLAAYLIMSHKSHRPISPIRSRTQGHSHFRRCALSPFRFSPVLKELTPAGPFYISIAEFLWRDSSFNDYVTSSRFQSP